MAWKLEGSAAGQEIGLRIEEGCATNIYPRNAYLLSKAEENLPESHFCNKSDPFLSLILDKASFVHPSLILNSTNNLPNALRMCKWSGNEVTFPGEQMTNKGRLKKT